MIKEELIEELENNESIVFENPDYDTALIGISSDGRAVYSYDKMVDYLMNGEDGMSLEDAEEFISYNTIRSLPYIQNSPIIVYHLED